ncbi:hypothetical protein [Acrocarpospora sp. B8E8]|uniref:hypothetical protein n=1 Tax=Acrocarpospora sp. B8E8 TaxID=3153572 RepID=UPI00325CD304
MNRRILAPLAAAVVLVAGIPAKADASPCNPALQPYGLIGDKWAQLGGVNTLGCALTAEYDVYRNSQWAGRRQSFTHGQVAWSPGQGSKMTLAAWKGGPYVYFNWGPTNPFSYERFLVRMHLVNEPAKWAQATFKGGTGSQIRWGALDGKQRFIVEGCDSGTFSTNCRQGWTIPVDAW